MSNVTVVKRLLASSSPLPPSLICRHAELWAGDKKSQTQRPQKERWNLYSTIRLARISPMKEKTTEKENVSWLSSWTSSKLACHQRPSILFQSRRKTSTEQWSTPFSRAAVSSQKPLVTFYMNNAIDIAVGTAKLGPSSPQTGQDIWQTSG